MNNDLAGDILLICFFIDLVLIVTAKEYKAGKWAIATAIATALYLVLRRIT